MSTPPAAYRLLIAEDDTEIATLLQRYFSARNVAVTLAPDGEVAWQHFLAQPFDAVLSDLMMPRKSGRDLVLHIHGHITRARTPIIITTASVQGPREEEELRAQLKVEAVFRKPLPLRDLVARLEQVTQRGRSGASKSGSFPAVPERTRSSGELHAVAAPPGASPRSEHPAPTGLRPPSSPPATAPPPVFSGAHSPTSLPVVAAWLRQAFESQLTGVLQLHSVDGPRALFLHQGLVVDVATGVADESLVSVMLEAGLVAAQDARRVAHADAPRDVAHKLGLPAWCVVNGLELQARKVLTQGLCNDRGHHVWTPFPGDPVLGTRMRMDPLEVVQRAALQADLNAILSWLRPLLNSRLHPTDAFNERVLLFARVRPDSVVPLWMQERLTVRDAVLRAQSHGPEALRDLAALLLSGTVEAGQDAPAVRAPSRGRGPVLGATALQPWPSNNPTTLEHREALALEWLRTWGADAYAVMDVVPRASITECQTALDALESRLAPSLDMLDLGPAKTYVAIMRARLGVLRHIFADEERRQHHDAERLVRQRPSG